MEFVRGRCLLKNRLKQAKRSQRWLASKMNRPEQQISDWVNDRYPMNADSMRNIAHWLKCDMEAIYEWIWVED